MRRAFVASVAVILALTLAAAADDRPVLRPQREATTTREYIVRYVWAVVRSDDSFTETASAEEGARRSKADYLREEKRANGEDRLTLESLEEAQAEFDYAFEFHVQVADGCLAPDTRVLLASGDTRTLAELFESARRLDSRDRLRALDVSVRSARGAAVRPLFVTRAPRRAPLVVLETDGGRLALTPDHRVLRADGRAVAASSLRAGDELPSGLRVLAVETTPASHVYNLAFANGDESFLANGVAVLGLERRAP